MQRLLIIIATLLISSLWTSCQAETVRVAAVHFRPVLGNVPTNRAALAVLTEQAAAAGAKIIVHTEMATSGYAFFSKAEIAKVAETVPGETTKTLGSIAKKYGAYIVIGMPIVEPETNLFFNAAVLIGPDGEVAGIYKKHNNLLESSYNATTSDDLQLYPTPHGRLAIVICADLFYSEFARAAAVKGADLLLAPANVGITTDFIRVRAYENDLPVIVANRYGTETAGTLPNSFSEESFTIKPPFPYDFSHDSVSAIVSNVGEILAEANAPNDAVIYADIPIHQSHRFPVVRRPDMYGLIAQDTLDEYTETQFGQAKPQQFAVAAVDIPHTAANASVADFTTALDGAMKDAQSPKLIVFPAGLIDELDAGLRSSLQAAADASHIDIVVHADDTKHVPRHPAMYLITPFDMANHATYEYHVSHRKPGELTAVADDFLVVDRPYGRVALLTDADLLAPETSVVMAHMGVDVIAVSADSPNPLLGPLLASRTADFLHIVMANHAGTEGIYVGGYRDPKPVKEHEGLISAVLDSGHVRDRKRTRFFDPLPLLRSCSVSLC